MNIFPVFHPPKICKKKLIVTYFVFVFHVVTLAILLISIFQISNCNVLCNFSLFFFSGIHCIVLNCYVSCHRASLKHHTLKEKGLAFRNIGKYTSMTAVKSALIFF